MSGGHFNYAQDKIEDIIDSIQYEIDKSGKPLTEEEIKGIFCWSLEQTHHYEYPRDIIDEFRKGIYLLRVAKIYAQRIDWLISGDDGEETFRERLKEDLEKL
jgi:FKBP-type peptidyl-prolyl cis-trans isomerase (trigger factor)